MIERCARGQYASETFYVSLNDSSLSARSDTGLESTDRLPVADTGRDDHVPLPANSEGELIP